MRINSVNIKSYQNSTLAFKSKEYNDDGIFGYSDSFSEKRRNEIRDWQKSYYIPYQSIYEKECNLSEYQMQQLLGQLMKKPKSVDSTTVTRIDAYNVRAVDKDATCYRGSTLKNKPEELKILKSVGIERIIDLVGYQGYADVAKEAGLEYYAPEFGRAQMWVWSEEAFITKEEKLQEAARYYSPADFEKNKKYLAQVSKAFDKHSQRSVERFVRFVETMQKGYYYIGCEYGTYTTDDYMSLNALFNPKANFAPIPCSDLLKLDLMENLYNKLTPNDKLRMGWSKEFGENVLKRIRTKQDEIINLTKRL